jgi:hypothetical protein
MTNKMLFPSKPKNYIQGYLDDEYYFQFIPNKLSKNQIYSLRNIKLK